MSKREDLIKNVVGEFHINPRLIVTWATGVGKSRAAIEIIKSIDSPTPPRVLLLVAEIAHKDNWKKEFYKWGAQRYYNYTQIECYQSIQNCIGKEYDLIVLDEAHHINTPLRLSYLKDIHTSNIIAFSATLSSEDKKELSDIYGSFTISNFTTKEAIDSNILPTPKVYIIPLTLDNKVKDQQFVVTRGKKDKRICLYSDVIGMWGIIKNKTKYPNINLTIIGTQREKYAYLSNKVDYYKRLYFGTQQEFANNKWMQYALERKRYLGSIKLSAAQYIIDNVLVNKRFICFCTNIEQAKILNKDNAVYSGKKDSLNILKDFNNGSINSLFAINMLKEGINLNNIEAGLIIQLDGKELSFIQKFGRVLRSDSPEQYILYYKDTHDEDYVNKIKEILSPEYFTEITMEELKRKYE